MPSSPARARLTAALLAECYLLLLRPIMFSAPLFVVLALSAAALLPSFVALSWLTGLRSARACTWAILALPLPYTLVTRLYAVNDEALPAAWQGTLDTPTMHQIFVATGLFASLAWTAFALGRAIRAARGSDDACTDDALRHIALRLFFAVAVTVSLPQPAWTGALFHYLLEPLAPALFAAVLADALTRTDHGRDTGRLLPI